MPPATESRGPVANIGPRERRKRMLMGAVMLVVAAGALAVLAATGVHRAWRLALFVPFSLAALGWFQARERT